MPYQEANGYNQAGSLATLTIQPQASGIEYVFVVGGDGIAVPKGYPRQIWRWSSVTAEDVETIISDCGLSYDATPSREKTVRTTRNDAATGLDRDFANANCIMTLPPRPRFKYFYEDFEIELSRIEFI